MRYALEISFDGTAYNGWQRQNNAPSVQEMIESRINQITGQECQIIGCGRTDTGVHASQFIIHTTFDSSLPRQFIHKLNSILPEDIAIHRMYIVPDDFNARFDALYRTYHYRIHRSKNPFIRLFSYRYPYNINVELLNKAAEIIKQYDEFGSFCKSKSQNKTDFCKIMECAWEVRNGETIFVIQADRFLRNMVRAIVGTMLEINEGKLTTDDLHRIIQSGDRKQAGRSAPAHGLSLAEIGYNREHWKEIYDN